MNPTDPTPLTAKFVLTIPDVVAANEFVNTKPTADRRWMGAVLMFIGSVAATGVCLAIAGALTVATAGLACVATGVFVAFYARKLWPSAAKTAMWAAADRVRGDRRRTVTLDAEGVRIEHEFGHTFYRWAGVRRAVVTNQHLLLFMRHGSAMPVPRRAFARADDFATFAAAAQARAVPDADEGRPTGGFPVLPVTAARADEAK